ncbi:transcriptional regulator TbsP [Halocatena pleomorpha]|uniref:Uncharacterized protein n=1 Tax=Halocatena pleomorpha TaxID=1785090 RepID=A0A3P3R769_9EURY|nr:DUF5821 family protein [Halocatena pleomorpha]RRJ29224.1 hypothetical protein EIK79_13900 [Halocatena pleomorpha]
MRSNILESGVEGLLESVLGDATGELYLINPSREILEVSIPAIEQAEDVSVRLLAGERVLKDVLDDFIVGSTAADLIEADRLALRTFDEPTNTLIVSDDAVTAVVSAGGKVAGLVTDDTEFVSATRDQYENEWDAAEQFKLRTPPISRVRSTLSEEIGADVAEDFDGVLTSLETARGNGEGLDEVTISLLVAAKNEELLYDISKWGEDVGIASKATFSRTKTRLEEMGLVDTEKVPIDVGRPRLRLILGDDRLQSTNSDDLANVAQSLMAS